MGLFSRDFDGWANSATQGFAIVLWNDAAILKRLDLLIKRGLRSRAGIKLLVPREDWWDGEIDTYSIIFQRASELLDQDVIDNNRLGDVKIYLDGSDHKKFLMSTVSVNCCSAKILNSNSSEARQPEKEKDMKCTISKIENVTFVNGMDARKITLDEQIDLIRNTENRINELEAVKTKSKKISEEIERLKNSVADFVALMDAQ
jgi:hypothetical protein